MENKPQIKVKIEQVEKVAETIEASETIILADYSGLTVAEVTELRAKVREVGGSYKVIKNNIMKRATHKNDIEFLDEFLVGPTAVAFSDEPASLAKALVSFAKDHEDLQVKAGILTGELLSLEEITNLSKLPPREELLGKLVSSMQSPMYGFAGAAQALLRNFVYALSQIKDQKAAAEN